MNNILKKTIIALTVSALVVSGAKADEGMWLPSLVGSRIADMQAKGFKLSASDIYDVNQASLKDAVVLFGRGCTGELISSEGLVLTNHHCGYSMIQRHSTVEHDYLKDGFWAMTQKDELPCKGLTVSFLDRMEDVTSVILQGYEPTMDENERVGIVRKNSKALTDKIAEEGLRGTVEALYYGNQYFLFVYREYRDVRFVGAPPSSIGKFGGDTDNWMWPRHTGDFSMFRVYTDKDGKPADYSEDNVPLHPRKYFKISTQGVHENDFTFIYGFPGSTQEYIHSEGVRYIAEVGDPHKIALRTLRLDIQKKYMKQSQDLRIRYSAKNATISNAWKKWQGESGGIRKMNTVAVKQQFEKDFAAWAKGSAYEGLTERIAQIYKDLEPYAFATDYYNEAIRTIEIANFAASISKLYKDGKFSQDRLEGAATGFYKDYYLPIDKESFIAVIQKYADNVPQDFQPEYFKAQMSVYGNAESWAEDLFGKTLFADAEKVKALTDSSAALVAADPATLFAEKCADWFAENIRPVTRRLNQELQLAYRDYMRGQMEFAAGAKAFYPDANLTLRVAYGHVSGYEPMDGVYYKPSSTLEGVMEKDNPEIFDYNIPQRLRDIYAAKDFGKWTDEKGRVPVCFIATNHTTGGNSGSPVINADGNLIGINFDRVWEGTMSDIVFDPDVCRNIALDIRYVLFTLDRLAGAQRILKELTLVD